jgi:FKBP-type peptidyl-prolyl cis-trans isomerase FklB
MAFSDSPFADSPNQCENMRMRKLLVTSLSIFATGTIFVAGAFAQQTPPPAAPAPAAAQSSGAAAPKTTRPKPKPATPGATKPATAPVLKTQKEKFSYALGMNLGAGLMHQEVDVDPTVLGRGLRDGFNCSPGATPPPKASAGTAPKPACKTLLTEDEARTILAAAQADFKQKQQAKQAAVQAKQAAVQAKMALEAAANKKIGDAFLADNKAKDGVVTLPSGLQYKILTPGDGPKPVATDTVVCDYKGTLIDGTEFDSSYKRGEPATFPVSGVIKGWTEALQLMPVGSKWQLFVPADLAYGDQQRGPQIVPGSTLIFEVELKSIKAPEKAPDAQPGATAAPATPPPATPKPQ